MKYIIGLTFACFWICILVLIAFTVGFLGDRMVESNVPIYFIWTFYGGAFFWSVGSTLILLGLATRKDY